MSSETCATDTAATKTAAADRARRMTFRPNVDIRDFGTEVTITADIPGACLKGPGACLKGPGACREGIDVTFEDGVLSLQADVPAREPAGTAVRREYGVGDYRRSFRLGDGFDASRITADYRDGVLAIKVPRLAAVLPRKIEVTAG